MKRGSCPDLDDLMEEDSQSKDSWLSAFNKVVRDGNVPSNTVSLGEYHSKPGLDSVFGTQSSGRNDATYITANTGRSIMCNNHDILSLSRDDVMAMSLSDAHETLFQLRVEGYMMKRDSSVYACGRIASLSYPENPILLGGIGFRDG